MALQNLVNRLRQFRSIHKWIGISVFLFMIITASTGVLLGWKKNVNLLQPPTLKGSTVEMDEWVSFGKVAQAAMRGIDSVTSKKIEIDRMDVRPDKGIIKVTFTEDYWEAQIDGGTGKVLSVAQRHADWIEHLMMGRSLVSHSKYFTPTISVGDYCFYQLPAFGFGMAPR
jgi:uncharacterized iron-regulated membrane protein